MERDGRHTGNHFLDSLSFENFDRLAPYLTQVDLTGGAVVCQAGDDIGHVWFPTTAILSVVTVMLDGQDVEACTIGHESAYGLLNALGSSKAIDRVIAQVPGSALKLPAGHLRAAASFSLTVTDTIIRHAQANVAQVQQSVACNALHGVDERLCRWLLMTADRTRSNRLPLTQEFLGFMLGVQRTTVNAAARILQAAGFIRYSRGMIEVLDRAGLMAGACECYGSVLDKHAELLGQRPFDATDPFGSPLRGVVDGLPLAEAEIS